jgi:hypothetical protein
VARAYFDHRETLALSIEPLDRADPSADVQPVADGRVGPLDPNPALTIHVGLSAHREPAVTVLEEPWRALVGAIEKPRVHELPEAGRIQVDDGLPATGNEHDALDRPIARGAPQPGPEAPESLRPLLDESLSALEELPGRRLGPGRSRTQGHGSAHTWS